MNKEEILNLINSLTNLMEDCDRSEKNINSLENKLTEVLNWGFGNYGIDDNKEECIRKWINLHFDLPIPKILETTEVLEYELYLLYLFIDVYDCYLRFKK